MNTNTLLKTVVPILLCVVLAVMWFFDYRRLVAYRNQTHDLSSQLELFDSELGRAKQYYEDRERMKDLYLENVSEAIQDEINLYKNHIETLGIAVAVVKGSGGGRVVPRVSNVTRSPAQPVDGQPTQAKPPGPEANGTHESWAYKDWRLTAEYNLGEFKYDLHQRLKIVLVETSADSVRPFYLEVSELDASGKPIPSSAKLESFEIHRKKYESSFEFLAPKFELSLALMGGSRFDFGPELSFSLSSYGSFRFLRVGAYLGKESVGLSASPVSINLGELTGVFDNFWLSPSYYLSNGSFYGASLGATF